MASVSVTIPCYNSEPYIAETIQSVIDQSYDDWEIIALDDGSADRTAEIVRGFNDPRIRYYHQENQGLSVARNRSVGLAQGNYIALLDHDDLWLPGKLQAQVKLLETQPGVGMVYTDTLAVNGSGKALWRYSERFCPYRGRVLAALLLTDFMCCSSVIFRKALFDEIGPFSLDLRIAEEYDFFLRAAERYEIEFVPAVLTKWRIHMGNASRDTPRTATETGAVVLSCLDRNPELRQEIGGRAQRLRLSGFGCNLDQARFLRRLWSPGVWWKRDLGSAKDRLKVARRYLLALLDPARRRMYYSVLGPEKAREKG